MIHIDSFIDQFPLVKSQVLTRHWIPFFHSFVQAGFPSPAENYIEKVCDLNELCITNAEATYFVRASGDSMKGDRIEPGDVLVVDCSLEAQEGRIVIVCLNGEHTVKRIHYRLDDVLLIPSNPVYSSIPVGPGDDFRVFGVVTYVLHKTY